MLEESDGTSLEQAPESADEDAELPLEMETAPDEASAAAESELELDFDLEGELQEKEALVDSAKTGEELLASNLLASGDAHLHDEEELEGAEFQEEIEEIEAITDDFATEEFTDTRNLYGQTDVLTDAEDEPPPSLMQKPRSRKPLLVILILIILALGVLIIPNSLGIKIPYLSDIKIPYLSDLDLKIPFLSNLLNPEEQDIAGNLKVIPIDKSINAKFIDNSNVGQLFVISGKIKNEYDHPRSFIKVTGKIYQKGKKLAKTSTVYCGNMISDSELAQMDIAAINKRLQNSFGDKKSNLKIKTGMEIPFMIVFDNLPQNLDEYSIEASGSSI
jgi:hypothetical protein